MDEKTKSVETMTMMALVPEKTYKDSLLCVF